MLNKIHAQTLALSLMLCSTFAFGQCELRGLALETLSEQTNYNVLSSSQFSVSNNYRVAAEFIGQDCVATITVELEDGNKSLFNGANEALIFEWFGQGHLSGNQWKVELTSQQPTTTFQLRYPSLQWIEAGNYQGKLEASLLNQPSTSSSLTFTKTLPISMTVLPIAKIQFYGLAQNYYQLDMGELSSHKIITSAPKLWVQTNSGYSISVSSDNQGKLRHESDDNNWDIDYSMSIEQRRLDLRQTIAQLTRNQPTSGSPMDIQFEVGDTNNRPGGKYRDTIQISIEPNLTLQP